MRAPPMRSITRRGTSFDEPVDVLPPEGVELVLPLPPELGESLCTRPRHESLRGRSEPVDGSLGEACGVSPPPERSRLRQVPVARPASLLGDESAGGSVTAGGAEPRYTRPVSGVSP